MAVPAATSPLALHPDRIAVAQHVPDRETCYRPGGPGQPPVQEAGGCRGSGWCRQPQGLRASGPCQSVHSGAIARSRCRPHQQDVLADMAEQLVVLEGQRATPCVRSGRLGFLSSLMSSVSLSLQCADQSSEFASPSILLPRQRVVAEHAEHAAAGARSVPGLCATRDQPVMRRLDDDADLCGFSTSLMVFGDLRRHLLLDLETLAG